MKNLLNIVYREETTVCPCGNTNGCKTVSEMYACNNLDKRLIKDVQKFAIILPSKMNNEK